MKCGFHFCLHEPSRGQVYTLFLTLIYFIRIIVGFIFQVLNIFILYLRPKLPSKNMCNKVQCIYLTRKGICSMKALPLFCLSIVLKTTEGKNVIPQSILLFIESQRHGLKHLSQRRLTVNAG